MNTHYHGSINECRIFDSEEKKQKKERKKLKQQVRRGEFSIQCASHQTPCSIKLNGLHILQLSINAPPKMGMTRKTSYLRDNKLSTAQPPRPVR